MIVDDANASVPPYHEEMQISQACDFLEPGIQDYQEIYAINYQTYEASECSSNAPVEKPKLTLYVFSACPYCRKVTNYLSSVGKSISTKDIRKDPSAKKKLTQIAGKTQVPCLVISGKPMHESNDIIKWLKENPNAY